MTKTCGLLSVHLAVDFLKVHLGVVVLWQVYTTVRTICFNDGGKKIGFPPVYINSAGDMNFLVKDFVGRTTSMPGFKAVVVHTSSQSS